jgi:hypothetical protein
MQIANAKFIIWKTHLLFQDLHSAFLALSRDGQREMSRKINVLEASLKKVEAVCYNINVRSTEIPKHLVRIPFSS